MCDVDFLKEILTAKFAEELVAEHYHINDDEPYQFMYDLTHRYTDEYDDDYFESVWYVGHLLLSNIPVCNIELWTLIRRRDRFIKSVELCPKYTPTVFSNIFRDEYFKDTVEREDLDFDEISHLTINITDQIRNEINRTAIRKNCI